MLDDLGLTERDDEGYRLRSDGQGRLRIEMTTVGGQFIQFTQIAEMIREQWGRIGIQADVNEVERSLAITRVGANQLQIHLWQNDGTEHFFTAPWHLFPVGAAGLGGSNIGPLWAQWLLTNGEQGREPSAAMKRLMGLWKQGFGLPEAERIEVGKEMWRVAVDQQWVIGTVGLSPAGMGVRVRQQPAGQFAGTAVQQPGRHDAGAVAPRNLFLQIGGSPWPGTSFAAC